MRKSLIYIFVIIGLVILCAIIAVLYMSFKVVRPTTKQINQKLLDKYSELIYVPQGIRPSLTFTETAYNWEMETREHEVVRVFLKYNPAFTKNDKDLIVSLEMDPIGDPSIFNKSLPALIADEKSLKSAQEPEKADISANAQVGYSKMHLLSSANSGGRVVKVTWDFKKEDLDSDTKALYLKIKRYPIGLLKFLYGVPNLLISLVGA